MREIKFRVWDDENKEYYYSDIFDECLGFFKSLKDDKNPEARCSVFPRIKYLQQFTGLKDKNGKEIYEGDVLKGRNIYGNSFFKIEWSEMFSCWKAFSIKENDKLGFIFIKENEIKYEVIGNIFETPELLK